MAHTIHTHDCPTCTYLGPYCMPDGRAVDLWHHGDHQATVIVRYSSDGPDYSSGAWFAEHNPGIAEAVKRARLLGLEVKD